MLKLKTFFSLISAPLIIGLLATLTVLLPMPAGFGTVALYMAYGLFIAAALLGVHFHRLNVLFGMAAAWVVLFGLTHPWALERLSLEARDLIWVAAWWLLPVNAVLFGWAGERGLLSLSGLVRFLWVVLQGLVVAWLAVSPHASQVAVWLTFEFVPDSALGLFAGIPQPGLALAVLAAVALGVKAALDKHGILPLGWLGMLLASLAGLYLYPDRGAVMTFFGAGALMLTVGLMQLSYRLAYYDELTGIPGRRALYEAMGRLGGRYTVAMTDIDFFKKFNDTHGHDVGDQVLKMVAVRLSAVRGGGKAYRYGGEEFTILFDGKEAKEAAPFLEEIRVGVEKSPFVKRAAVRPKEKPKQPVKTKGNETLHVTISIGAANKNEKHPNPEAVMKAADEALYKAKEAGRNRVVTA